MAFGSDKKTGPGDFGYNSSDSQSYFGKTMRIEGEITSNEDLTVEGKVEGQLEVAKTLIVGKDGHINGKISASVVRISGVAEGDLVASQKLEITSEGKFTGNIYADTIKVAEGAQLRGSINIEDENSPRIAAQEKKEEPVDTTDVPQDDTNPIEPVVQEDNISDSSEEDLEEEYPEETKEQVKFPEKKESSEE